MILKCMVIPWSNKDSSINYLLSTFYEATSPHPSGRLLYTFHIRVCVEGVERVWRWGWGKDGRGGGGGSQTSFNLILTKSFLYCFRIGKQEQGGGGFRMRRRALPSTSGIIFNVECFRTDNGEKKLGEDYKAS